VNRPRPLSLTFFGKGVKYQQCTRVPGTLGLDFEKAYDEYQLLLRQANYLFTYDFMTGVCSDAVVHGAIPVIMSMAPWNADEIGGIELKYPYITWEQYQARRSDSDILATYLAGRQSFLDTIRQMRADWPAKIGRLVHLFETTFDTRCARLQETR